MKRLFLFFISLTLTIAMCSCKNRGEASAINNDTDRTAVEPTAFSGQEKTTVTAAPTDKPSSDDNKGAEQELTAFESSATGLKYYLSLPKGYNADDTQNWPLILFLHGSGDRGDDLELVKRSGITNIAEKDGLEFIAVYPQCPLTEEWEEMTGTISDFLDELTDSLRVDADRICLTGFSMGGYGTWYMALEYPDRFAAIAPVCGSLFPQDINQVNADSLKALPIWAFHGSKDTVVPPQDEKSFIDLIQNSGGNVKYTAYEELGHEVWIQAYNEELYDWLLQQKR